MQLRNESVNRQLYKDHLRTIAVQDDGNCFFRSLSMCLFGHQNNHNDLRKTLSNHIRSQAEAAPPADRAVLIRRAADIAKCCVWVTEDVIVAAADYLRRNINIYISATQSSPLVYPPSTSPVGDSLTIASYEPSHYMAVTKDNPLSAAVVKHNSQSSCIVQSLSLNDKTSATQQ